MESIGLGLDKYSFTPSLCRDNIYVSAAYRLEHSGLILAHCPHATSEDPALRFST